MPPILIAGPTAVGKSEVAMSLADNLDGEIISVDSMQVYRGMDIGTAKPSQAECARIPHHLLDIQSLDQQFDVAQFVLLANRAITEIQSRNRLPILCGGTGLYFKAWLQGIGSGPPGSPALRKALEQTPLPDLLHELAEKDPATYEKIDRQNPRRVVRALEVIRLTGESFSSQRAKWDSLPAHKPMTNFAFLLIREPSDLMGRIEARVEAMFTAGLLEETERLLKNGLASNTAAMQALGYKQIAEFLQGKRSLPETKELIKIRTRQFAKRQMTWFKKYAADFSRINLTFTSVPEAVRKITASISTTNA